MAGSSTNWEERGQRAVTSATDLASGIFQGFRGIGTRIKAARFRPVIEAFCAYTGLIAAENGRLKQVEIDSFRSFLIEQRNHPVIGHFSPDELVDKFRGYAIKAFLEENDVFVSVLDPIQSGSEEGQLIMTGCLAITYADGICDAGERQQLENLASRLSINLDQLTGNMGVSLPVAAPRRPSLLGRMVGQPPAFGQQQVPNVHSQAPNVQYQAPNVQQQAPNFSSPRPQSPPVTPSQGACTFCQGKGCPFCNT